MVTLSSLFIVQKIHLLSRFKSFTAQAVVWTCCDLLLVLDNCTCYQNLLLADDNFPEYLKTVARSCLFLIMLSLFMGCLKSRLTSVRSEDHLQRLRSKYCQIVPHLSTRRGELPVRCSRAGCEVHYFELVVFTEAANNADSRLDFA